MKSRILKIFKASNEIDVFLSTSKLRYWQFNTICYSKITVFGFTDTKTSYAINKSKKHEKTYLNQAHVNVLENNGR